MVGLSLHVIQVSLLQGSSPGFDLEGQKELKKLVHTNKWIGTSGGYDSGRKGFDTE
jgi:hypothetical protein